MTSRGASVLSSSPSRPAPTPPSLRDSAPETASPPAAFGLRGRFEARLVVVLAVACTSFACAPSSAAPPSGGSGELASLVRGEVTADALTAHAREITRHERPSGSPGENAAIDYIVGVLRQDSVPVEVHEFLAYTSDPVSAMVEVPGTDVAPPAITMSYSASVMGLEAPLVDVGARADLPQLALGTGERLELEDDPGEGDGTAGDLPDVAGAIAMVEGQPGGSTLTLLERLGAAGVIFASAQERVNDLIVTTTWGQPSLLNRHRLNRLPVAHVTRSGADALRALLAEGPVRVRLTTETRTG